MKHIEKVKLKQCLWKIFLNNASIIFEIAEKEFYISQEYYEEQQTNLGNKFKSEVYNTLKRIKNFLICLSKVKKILENVL